MKGVFSNYVARCVGMARAILLDREVRRKVMARWLMLALGMLAIGLWAIPGWLSGNVMRFILWWGVCGLVTCGVMLFALYDALAVIREERDKFDGD